MTLSGLLRDVSFEVLQMGGGLDAEISTIAIDSRKVTEGGLFICLLGLSVDGHMYIDDVAKKGTRAIIVEKYSGQPLWPEGGGRVYPRPADYDGRFQYRESYPPGVTVIQVENSRQAMSFIAANAYGRPADKLCLIGVTGTNGKTTTTQFIDTILRSAGYKTGLIGTNGARVGDSPVDIPFATSTTPDPLELHEIFAYMARQGVKYVVMEVSSHALAFFKVEGLQFKVGVFTNLTQDHLDLHGTMDNYKLAKAQLFAQSRFALVNIDDESTKVMLGHFRGESYLTYGLDSDAGLMALHIKNMVDGAAFQVNLGGAIYPFTLHAKGRFNVYNALAAIGACYQVGLPMDVICAAKISGVVGRIQDVPNDLGVHVLVDYAHSPDGIKNILSSVREFTIGRVVIIFGCGGDRDKAKRPIMGQIAGEMADFCILTSDNPRSEDPYEIINEIEKGAKPTGVQYVIQENRREAIFVGVKMLNPGDALIIAGKGHEDYQIIGTTKHYFSDYETAVKAIKQGQLFPSEEGN